MAQKTAHVAQENNKAQIIWFTDTRIKDKQNGEAWSLTSTCTATWCTGENLLQTCVSEGRIFQQKKLLFKKISDG